MTTTKVTRTVVATVKGKMPKEGARGPYLSVQVLRQGMQYPETFNCWDMKQLEHVKLNSLVSLILNRDGTKADKQDDGQVGSYWWSIAGVAESPINSPVGHEARDPQDDDDMRPYSPPVTSPELPQPVPQALGACQNHAMAFIESGIIPIPEGRDPINFLWELRDRVYRNVNQKPYQPEGFCYQHQALFDHTEKGKRGAKYHAVENGYCVQGFGFVAKKETP
jgi:hypothetical protein